MTSMALATLAAGVGIVSAVTDARTGRIPDAVTVPAALAGLALRACEGSGHVPDGVAGFIMVATPPWLLYRTTKGRGIGGGDVKLFAALGAIVGVARGLEMEVSAVLLLGVFALVRLAFVGRLWQVTKSAARLAANPFLPARLRIEVTPEALTEMRMGPAIAVAVVTTLVMERAAAWVQWLV